MFALISYVQILLTNIVIFLLLTLIIATITLMERKILSLVQRRVGPNYIGYRGRLQFIADALKLLVKHIVIINKVNKFLFLLLPATVLIMCYLFWLNLVWAPNLAVCEIEYNLLFAGMLSMFFSFLMFLVGWVSKNKYAVLSSTRVLITTLNLEVFINFFFNLFNHNLWIFFFFPDCIFSTLLYLNFIYLTASFTLSSYNFFYGNR